MPVLVPPVATPVEPTVATDVSTLLQVPPAVASDKFSVDPEQTCGLAGEIAAGEAFTVTTFVVKQLVTGSVYVMVGVPRATPVTLPPASTVACRLLLLVHEPPDGELGKLIVCPVQTNGAPGIAEGAGFTVTVALAEEHAPME